MSYFVSCEWLKKQLEKQNNGQAKLVIVDTRYDLVDSDAGELAYRKSHIVGAFYASLSHDLSSGKRPDGVGGRHPLPDPNTVAQFFASLGIQEGVTVVAYDNQGGAMASRLRWLLEWIGFVSPVYVLEGGFAAWEEAGYEVTTLIPKRLDDLVLQVRLNQQMLLTQEQVKHRIGQPGTVIIDSRDRDRYCGVHEPIDAKAGHIPTAINHFWMEGKTEAGTWKSAEEQEKRFAGIDKEANIIVYCGSGVTATPNVFALREAGYRNVQLYAGSWSEWSSNPDNQVETGNE